ncbi:hypothetical protein V6N11_066090 [Hibiscus sabdariffa]|uniref:Cytochrome P450 n=2 Tax=Hibiscus sabdariffa TaxID=183260 RepID=A0ABR2NVA6_9ROSI
MDFLTIISLLIALPLLFFVLIFFVPVVKVLVAKFVGNNGYAPVKGTVFGQVLYAHHLYDYQTQVAKKLPTYRLVGLAHSEISTTDMRNAEHILKTSFNKYAKGRHLQENVSDLWGDGIFAADGDNWRQQRKLASYEFSTRVLRGFSCSVFRKTAAKLTRVVSKLAVSGQVIDFQDLFMKSAMDSIFKVGFGIDLNCLDWSNNEEGTKFSKAFDEANEMMNSRFFDTLWKLKRFLNIGSEASLKKNIKVIDKFIYNIISTKKELLGTNQNPNVKEDVLSRFLAESEKNPETMGDRYLCAQVDDILPDGHKVKKGDEVYYLSYAMGRMPYIWGENADEFRPERWLKDGVFQPESSFKFISFHVRAILFFL